MEEKNQKDHEKTEIFTVNEKTNGEYLKPSKKDKNPATK